jgi:hypothetical protein
MPSLILTLPILTDKVEAWRRFCQEMSGSRLLMYEASRRRLGITREQLALVETPLGAAVITTLEAQDMGQVLSQIITSIFPFDLWYREQLLELYGVTLAGYEKFLQPAQTSSKPKIHFEWNQTPHPN